jgi:hypothetical protein
VSSRGGGASDFILPGCRAPGDPGYDPNVDGTTAGLVIPASLGASAGQQFSSETAAPSFNSQLLDRRDPPARCLEVLEG